MTPEQESMIAKADIREIKLMDGSTIMAEILEEDEKALLLFEPLQVLVGVEAASFVPWFLTGNERYIQLYKEKMLAASSCANQYKIKYLQATLKKEGLSYDFLTEELDEEETLADMQPETNSVH